MIVSDMIRGTSVLVKSYLPANVPLFSILYGMYTHSLMSVDPPKANDTLTSMMYQIGADYREYRFEGFPHSFPQFDESAPTVDFIFYDLAGKVRQPFI